MSSAVHSLPQLEVQRVIGWVDRYLNSGQHDGDQVVVREQQGTNNTAVTHMLDDGWGRKKQNRM